jgi:DNA primase
VKEEVKRAADIVEVIGQFVQLRKSGQNYVGLCPFHSEKTPSFAVNPAKGIFHCFGCKKGGDVLTFWMEYHNVSFSQALRDLAERYHVPLDEQRWTPGEKRRLEIKEALFGVNGKAAEFYRELLAESKTGEPGRRYLSARGIDRETAGSFMLGYAPEGWDALTSRLQKQGQDMDLAVQAGLVIPKRNGGWYDRFRGRLIFPILTVTNRVAGFGARILAERDKQPKYLNTPETPVFRKGEILYGLGPAGPAIRKSGRAVVVEGYTDALALHKYGITEAVATLGTALTRSHIRILKGYASEVVVVFDPDEAGRKAAVKSLPLFLQEGVPARVLVLPGGEDPDGFVNREGAKAFWDLVEAAVPMLDYFVDLTLAEAGESPESRARAVNNITAALSVTDDAALKAFYIKRVSERTGLSEALLAGRARMTSGPRRSEERASVGDGSPAARLLVNERNLLDILFHYPEFAPQLLDCECEVLLSSPAAKAVLRAAKEHFFSEGRLDPEGVALRMKGDQGPSLVREILVSEPFCPKDAVDSVVQELKSAVLDRLSERISEAVRQGDLEKANQLLRLKAKRQGQAAR